MKNEIDVIRDVAGRFASAAIDYMLTGSLAMNYYAQPRMTRDIDVVVALKPGDADTITSLFSPDYYVARESVSEAIARQSIFNLIHQESVIKVDCIVRKEGDYRRLEFERRRLVRVRDFEVWVVSKEDLIISKLHWARDSRSQLQLGDVRNLLATGYDAAYLEEWVGRWAWAICCGSACMNDTSPEMEGLVREMIMSRTGEERFVMGALMFDAARELILASFPTDLPASELRQRLFERIYGYPLPA